MNKITIARDGISGHDDKGNVYQIEALVIRKDRGQDAIYYPGDSFFKSACLYNTQHYYKFSDNGKVLIY